MPSINAWAVKSDALLCVKKKNRESRPTLTGIGLGTLGGSPQGGLVTHTNTIHEIAQRQPGILCGGAHGREQTPDLGWERDGQGWERRSGHTTRRLTTHTTGHTKNKHRNKARTVMHHAATNGPKAAQRPTDSNISIFIIYF